MISKVKQSIGQYNMLCAGDRVTVGLSGGADSIALTHILYTIKDEYGFSLSCVHINHGIRGEEAFRDEEFVKSFCGDLGIELSVYHYSVPKEKKKTGETEEECGRRIRYNCFREASMGGKIATAHTLTDNVETLLFHIIRGTALQGLCGIPPVRDNIIRPLINCTREEIESYCRENHLAYVTDSTNLSAEYTRNGIRLNIVPEIKKINPSYEKAFQRMIASIRLDNDYLSGIAQKIADESENGIDIDLFKSLHRSVSSRVIAAYVEKTAKICLEYRHIELLLSNLHNGFCLDISKDYFVKIENNRLFTAKKKKAAEAWSYICKSENNTNYGIVEIKTFERHDDFQMENGVFYADNDKITGRLMLSSRQEGDKITLLNRKVTKSLKKLFIEDKIPFEERMSIPVLRDDNSVIWVYGYGINANCIVTKNTKSILQIKLLKST